MHALLMDLGYGLRQLKKSPGFALTALLSLGLSIGATTSIFSVVYGVLGNPYPYKDPERLVHLRLFDQAGHERGFGLNGPQIQRLRQANCVQAATGEDGWSLTTTDGDLPEDVEGDYLTPNAFEFFGVPALVGRGFGPSDALDGQDPQPVVVLGYKFWMRHYGGDRGIVGRKIQLVHKTYTVIGVVPERFTWGDGDVYLPLKLTSDPTRFYSPEVRLKPGVSYAAASAEIGGIVKEFAKADPNRFPTHFRLAVRGLNEMFVERLGKTLFLLLGAVGLLLLIGCANVSILLLARGTARGHELAVRAAVGASRVRIVSQLLIESLLLAGGGAGLGVLLAFQTVALIAKWLPEGSFPNEAAIGINMPVLLFSVGLAVCTALLFGLSPAVALSKPEIAQVIQTNTRKATGGVKGKQVNGILIATQFALTVILLTSAGAAIGGFVNLLHVPLGYDPHNVMSVGIPIHDNTYMSWKERSTYFDRLQQSIAALPEVVATGISSNATPPDNGYETNFELFGRPANEAQMARVNLTGPEYFAVLHIALLRGRIWNHVENMRAANLGVINETMAHQYWPNGDALGQQMRFPKLKSDSAYAAAAPDSDGWVQVIGVVADAKDDGLRNPVKPAMYMPYTRFMQMNTQVLVRTRSSPLAVLNNVRAQVRSVNAEQQVFGNVRDLNQWIEGQHEWAQQRLVAFLFGGFAVLALALAAVGLYSVVSYTVAQRTSEIGIRMSLGAERSHILQLVFASTAGSVGAGLLVGAAGSVILHKVFQQWIEGESRDPSIFIGVLALLLVSASAACLIPALRASKIDPMIAIRYR